MHFEPRNACEQQYYNQMMSEVRAFVMQHPHFKETYARLGRIPDWMLSAVKQHALFYAADKCRGRG